MAQIELSGINKTYRVAKRPPGLFGALRGAFVREYTEIKAVESLEFSISEGELVGYIGPNGAGKSTTVKIMSGILVPDNGKCEILGRVPWKQRVAHVAQIGVVFGQRSQLWWDVPVSDSFELLRDIYSVSYEDYKKRLDELISVLDVEKLLSTPVRQLSLGQRMRCELVAALIHSPRILFLDEPSIGLDAVSKLSLRAFLQKMNREQGVTMILTTHDMDDIETLCQRVMVIGHGKLLYDGAISGLKKRYAPKRRVQATLANGGISGAELTAKLRAIIPIDEEAQVDARSCTLLYDPEVIPTHNMVAALASVCPVSDITVKDQDIEQMIATMYRELGL